jgi:hypothetical protein
MRSIILVTAFVAWAPIAFAQTYPPARTVTPGPSGGASSYTPHPSTPPQSAMSGQPNPENCGTPDEPKACPPMPRRPLQTYPANRQ